MCIRRLVERTAGPHSTSLRAGSPLRWASVGMTIHFSVGVRAPKKICRPGKKVTTSRDDKGECLTVDRMLVKATAGRFAPVRDDNSYLGTGCECTRKIVIRK